jgi:hypothetical protein
VSDPTPGTISVTIKGDEPGGKYNDAKSPGTWIVFHGSIVAVKEQIVEAFDYEADAVNRPLYDLVNEATKSFKAINAVGTQLGGTVLSKGGEDKAQADSPTEPAKSDEDDATKPIKAMIENATSRDGLKQLWAENKAVFDANPSLMDEWKAKGKSLSS